MAVRQKRTFAAGLSCGFLEGPQGWLGDIASEVGARLDCASEA